MYDNKRILLFTIYVIAGYILFRVECQSSSTQSCSSHCLQATTGSTCDYNQLCSVVCQPGYTGPRCDIACCNCNNCTLENISVEVVCHECADNFYQDGHDCKPCSSNCATNASSPIPICSQTDGACAFGCKSGYYGKNCAKHCSSNCADGHCSEPNGFCTHGCTLPILKGPQCLGACSIGCVSRECHQSGICLHGCIPQYWSGDCAETCHDNCKRPEDAQARICNETNGQCNYGCVNETLWGSNCTMDCSPTCVESRCEFETGTCTAGCIEGYQGNWCEEQITGRDKKEMIAIIVGSVVGGVLLLIAIICCICRRRKKKNSSK